MPLVAGNWKMNKMASEAVVFVNEIRPGLRAIPGVEKLIFPPATALMPLSALLDGSFSLGAQNLFWEAEGAYTGELSPKMLREFCQFVIIGHSERRTFFHESDLDVHRKVKAALEVGLRPVLCVGESLAQNEAGQAAAVVSSQLNAALDGVQIKSPGDLAIAYEPVWAIGTGKAATPDLTNTLHRNVIRATLQALYGSEIAEGIRILYGGSVNVHNAHSFFVQPEIDGALVGGASLKANEFVEITRAAAQS